MKFEKKTVYIYEINGKEKIKITNAAEAKKWDDIFDVAMKLDKILVKNDPGFKLSDSDRSDLCIYLARNRGEFSRALQSDGNGHSSNGHSSNGHSSNGAGIKPAEVVEVPEPAIPSSKDGFSL